MAKLSQPRHPEPFCERYFGSFFALWGFILIGERYLAFVQHGLFHGALDRYLPTWVWGITLLVIGLARRIAFRADLTNWRIGLSTTTTVILAAIAGIAWWAGLWSATAPLVTFVAVVSLWCHKALLRDIRLGL